MSTTCTVIPFFDCDTQNFSIEQFARMTAVQEVGTDNKGWRVYIACADSTSTSGLNQITDPAIITEITKASNWTTGVYAGSTAGILQWSIYIDTTYKIKYFFDGTNLIRSNYNDVTP